MNCWTARSPTEPAGRIGGTAINALTFQLDQVSEGKSDQSETRNRNSAQTAETKSVQQIFLPSAKVRPV